MPKDDPDALAEFHQAFGQRKARAPARPTRPSPPVAAGPPASTTAQSRSHSHAVPPPAPRLPASIDGLRELYRDAELRAQAAEKKLAEALASERAHQAEVAALNARLSDAADTLALRERELTAAKATIRSLEGRVAQLQGDLDRQPAAPDNPPASTESSDLGESGAVAAALRRFNTACLLHGVTFLVIVGGSPAYRRALVEGKDRRIDLRLVEGNVSRPPRFPPRTRIFIWGATELDHSTANAYPDAITIPHRGISRFLDAVSERIEGGG